MEATDAGARRLQQQQQGAAGGRARLPLDELQCAICLDTLHKPCVNSCGHAFCFWCFHHAMNGLSKSHCPLCRAEFVHFAAVCEPLHAYIATTFPAEALQRDAQTKEEEKEFHAESPALALPKASGPEAFACVGCKGLASPPAVLTCGHVVCARLTEQWPGCPVPRCVGGAPAGNLAVCTLLDSIVVAEHSEAYSEAKGRPQGCAAELSAIPGGADQAAADEAAQATTANPADAAEMVGSRVELHGLASEAGQLLNGQRGVIEEYDEPAGRYVVVVEVLPGPRAWTSRTNRVRARPANVRPVARAAGSASSETYTHFGRGCDGCGVLPIIGRCYRCEDCSEEIGYDLCGRCFDLGFHKREAAGGRGGGGGGRFNQAHRPEHALVEVEQEETFLHALQRAHPEMTVDQIMALVQEHQQAQEPLEEGEGDGEQDEENEEDGDAAV